MCEVAERLQDLYKYAEGALTVGRQQHLILAIIWDELLDGYTWDDWMEGHYHKDTIEIKGQIANRRS